MIKSRCPNWSGEVSVLSYKQFHDGFYDGLLIREDSVDIFLTTYQREAFCLSALGVVALASDGLRAGNIIFDVECRSGGEITLSDIREVHRFGMSPQEDAHAQNALAKAERDGLSLFVIGPTYGGSCLIMAKSFALVTRRQWIDVLCDNTQ